MTVAARGAMKGSIPSGGLEGMAVLVTGGGSGIGAACAARLAADGAAVTISGRTAEKLEAAAKAIEAGAGHGGSIQVIAGDVTNEDDVERMITRAAEPTGASGDAARAGAAIGKVMVGLKVRQIVLAVEQLRAGR